MVFLSGGPSHLDMFDMKPQAPAEYRGEFSPIKTNVPGIEISELMPMQARIADKFAILRGVQLAQLHSANEFYSGFPWQESPRASVPGEAQRPALGSVVSRLRGCGSGVPPYVSLENDPDWERAYYLGVEHEPFRVGGMRLLIGEEEESSKVGLANMSRHREISVQRLANRKDLLQSFDLLRRDLDQKGTLQGMDAFQARAPRDSRLGQGPRCVRSGPGTAIDTGRDTAKARSRCGKIGSRGIRSCIPAAPCSRPGAWWRRVSRS